MKDELIYSSQSKLCSYNVEKGHEHELHELSFSPTSVTAAFGYVAAGGTRSQLFVKNTLTGEVHFSGRVGGTINNSLSIAHHSLGSATELRLMVSNNNGHISVFTLPQMVLSVDMELETPINHVAVSSDGEKMASVGDCKKLYIHDLRHDYRRIHTFSGAIVLG